MSPWWPSTRAGQVGLGLWLLVHFGIWCPDSLGMAFLSAGIWYLVIAGVRALAYPGPHHSSAGR